MPMKLVDYRQKKLTVRFIKIHGKLFYFDFIS